jgi:MFS transporter, SP family, sugar:H+ symporter
MGTTPNVTPAGTVELEEVPPTATTVRLAEQKVTGFMIFFSIWVGIGGWITSFDNGYTGIVLNMSSFKTAFGVCTVAPSPAVGAMVQKCVLTATQQAANSAIYTVFIAMGALLSAVTGSYLGRRGTIQAAAIIVAIGAAGMLGTSGNFVAYIVCKCIGAIGLGLLYAAIAIYGIECTSPQKRGMLFGFYNIALGVGNLTSSAVCLGSSNIASDWAWKTPILCQIPLSIVYCLGSMLFPESPRWLLIKGKEESARRSFGKFYNKDPFSAEITAQVQEVQSYLEFEKAISSTTTWTEMFRRSYIRRTLLSTVLAATFSLCGQPFVVVYAAIFLASIGVTNPFLITFFLYLAAWGGSMFGPFIVEYGGRKFAVLTGLISTSLCLLIVSAVNSALGSASDITKKVLVAFFSVWAFFYAGALASGLYLALPEIHSIRMRTFGQAYNQTVSHIFIFAVTFWTPYMLNAGYGNMGINIGYFFFGLDIILIIVIFLYMPETARLSLEQIDDYFASGRPAWKTSLKRNKRIARGETYDVSPEARNAAIDAQDDLK